MTIKATCPGCGATYEFNDRLAGTKVRCEGCKESFVAGDEPEEKPEGKPSTRRADPVEPKPAQPRPPVTQRQRPGGNPVKPPPEPFLPGPKEPVDQKDPRDPKEPKEPKEPSAAPVAWQVQPDPVAKPAAANPT